MLSSNLATACGQIGLWSEERLLTNLATGVAKSIRWSRRDRSASCPACCAAKSRSCAERHPVDQTNSRSSPTRPIRGPAAFHDAPPNVPIQRNQFTVDRTAAEVRACRCAFQRCKKGRVIWGEASSSWLMLSQLIMLTRSTLALKSARSDRPRKLSKGPRPCVPDDSHQVPSRFP